MTIDRTQTQYHGASNAHLQKVGVATGSASYTTGGDPVTPATFGLARIDIVLFEPFLAAGVVYYAKYNPANAGVQFFVATTGLEAAAATNLSAATARFLAIGK